jgi:hypothetical protein
MTNSMYRLLPLLGLVLTAMPASANEASGQACAQTLPALARQIYTAVAPSVTPDGNIADLLRAYVRPQVMAGKISSSEARPAAEAAGNCLQALRH